MKILLTLIATLSFATSTSAGIVGWTFPFAWVKDTMGNAEALLVLAGFLVAGLVLTLFINERRGHAAAVES